MPAATPIQQKVIKGTFDKSRHENAPRPESGAPECPDWLPPLGKEAWDELAPQLEAIGLLDKIDGGLFAAYCDTYAKFAEVNKQLKDVNDCIQLTSTGYEGQSVLFVIRNKLLDQLSALSKHFGLSPQSRGTSAIGGELGKSKRKNGDNVWSDL